MNKKALSYYNIAFYIFATISCLILVPLFATRDVTRFNDIPIKYIILSFSLFTTLMIFLFFNGLSNKSFWISQIYFSLSIISTFLFLVANLVETPYVLVRILLILAIILSTYPFAPFVILIEDGLQYIGIGNDFFAFLIWIILFDAFFIASMLLGRLYRKKLNK